MSKEYARDCPALDLSEWKNRSESNNGYDYSLLRLTEETLQVWQPRRVSLHRLSSQAPSDDKGLEFSDAEICVVFASANEIRKCKDCRSYFIGQFGMPESWWSDSSRKSNGYFGCHAVAGHIDTWAYFEIKKVETETYYRWFKLNIFMRWFRSSHQTIVLAFDTDPGIASNFRAHLEAIDSSSLNAPYWFYSYLLKEVSRIQESAVWAIRDRVRGVEKAVIPKGRPDPNYRNMHDIARHAIHVSETLDVAVLTIKRMLVHHEALMPSLQYLDESREVHCQLQFYESFISSLRCRSASNEKRLQNEIQLAFNTVAQHDASTSVKIGLATQSDSVVMKSIAFVTLTFLPPTFVSAIFSMSFFDYGAESGWVISEKFWVYWAVAIPTTILTALAWYILRKYNVSVSPRQDEKRPLAESV